MRKDRQSPAEDVLQVPRYSLGDVAVYLRLPRSTLVAWCSPAGRRTPVIIAATPAGGARLSFLNLVEAHVLDALRREYRLRVSRIRLAVEYLRQHEGLSHPLAQRGLLTDRRDVFVQAVRSATGPELVNASRFGQGAMPDLLEAHLHRVEWNAAGLAARLYPFPGDDRADTTPRILAIDPAIAFGRPMVASRGIPVAPVASRFNAGEDLTAIAEDYGISYPEAVEAVRWYSARSYASAA